MTPGEIRLLGTILDTNHLLHELIFWFKRYLFSFLCDVYPTPFTWFDNILTDDISSTFTRTSGLTTTSRSHECEEAKELRRIRDLPHGRSAQDLVRGKLKCFITHPDTYIRFRKPETELSFTSLLNYRLRRSHEVYTSKFPLFRPSFSNTPYITNNHLPLLALPPSLRDGFGSPTLVCTCNLSCRLWRQTLAQPPPRRDQDHLCDPQDQWPALLDHLTQQPLRTWSSTRKTQWDRDYFLPPTKTATTMKKIFHTDLPRTFWTSTTLDFYKTSTTGDPYMHRVCHSHKKTLTSGWRDTSTPPTPPTWAFPPGPTFPNTYRAITTLQLPTAPRSSSASIARNVLQNTSRCRCTLNHYIDLNPTPTSFAGDACKPPMARITWSTQDRGWIPQVNPKPLTPAPSPTWTSSPTAHGLSRASTRTTTRTSCPTFGSQQFPMKPWSTKRPRSNTSGTTTFTDGAVLLWFASQTKGTTTHQTSIGSNLSPTAFGKIGQAKMGTTINSTPSPNPTPKPSASLKPSSPNCPRKRCEVLHLTARHCQLLPARPCPTPEHPQHLHPMGDLQDPSQPDWHRPQAPRLHPLRQERRFPQAILDHCTPIPPSPFPVPQPRMQEGRPIPPLGHQCQTRSPQTTANKDTICAQLASPITDHGQDKTIAAEPSSAQNNAWWSRPNVLHNPLTSWQPRALYTVTDQMSITTFTSWNGQKKLPKDSSTTWRSKQPTSLKSTTRSKTALHSCTTRSRTSSSRPNPWIHGPCLLDSRELAGPPRPKHPSRAEHLSTRKFANSWTCQWQTSLLWLLFLRIWRRRDTRPSSQRSHQIDGSYLLPTPGFQLHQREDAPRQANQKLLSRHRE